MYITEEAAVVTLTCGLLTIGYILLRYVKAQIYKEEKETNKKEMSKGNEEFDDLYWNYRESIRKRNALREQVDSLKGVVDERDDLRAQIYNFKTERDSVIEKLVGGKKMLQEREINQAIEDARAQERRVCKIKLEAQKEELEKITIERNALRVLLSRRIAEEAPCITRNDSTTGVNVETITFTPLEEE